MKYKNVYSLRDLIQHGVDIGLGEWNEVAGLERRYGIGSEMKGSTTIDVFKDKGEYDYDREWPKEIKDWVTSFVKANKIKHEFTLVFD